MVNIFKRKDIDMTQGPIFKNLVTYAIPLVIANILQMLFSLADTLILGLFAQDGNACVGAVSTTASLSNMIVSLFIGLSVGANVMVAKYIGAKNQTSVKKTIGTSVLLSIIAGAVLVVVGIFCSDIFLSWLGVDEQFMELATKYLTIYLCGAPFMMLYNFSANILRASGDTVRPMVYITIGGVLNVILNIILVVLTPYDVEGVAIATVASNAFAGIACFVALLRNKTIVKFEWKYLKIYKEEFIELIKVGVPSGINSCLFAFSNTLISSAINELGRIYGGHIVTGSGYANQIDNVIYVCMNAIALSAQAFISQNYGAKNFERIKKTLFVSLAVVSVVGIVISAIMVLTVYPLINLISKNADVAQAALVKTIWIGAFYVLCGIMDTMSYSLRGVGKSFTGMIVTLVGTVLFRVLWIWFIFPLYETEAMLYCIYSISWVFTNVTFVIIFANVLKNLKKRFQLEEMIETEGESQPSIKEDLEYIDEQTSQDISDKPSQTQGEV